MKSSMLFARNSNGSVQTWYIETEGAKYRTIYGQLGGAIQTTEWYNAYITNEGRSNARNAEEQAVFEAQAIFKRKLESGYWLNIDDIDKVHFVEPMLAKNWADRKDKVRYPVWVNMKYDGARSVHGITGPFSRNGKPWKTAQHISNALQPVFDKYPDIIFDGELYCHKLNNNFEKIMSLIKKTKPTAADIEESANTIQYHIYDIIDTELNYSQRLDKLNSILSECLQPGIIDNVICIAPSYRCNNEDEVNRYYEQFMELGYEGQIIRLNKPYENKRSSNLLKRKDFDEKEYYIVDIEEGEGNKTGMCGRFILLKDIDDINYAVKNYGYKHDDIDNEFNSNVKGSHEYLKELLDNKQTFKCKYAKVKYFGIGAEGAPRFPFVIGIRDGVGVD